MTCSFVPNSIIHVLNNTSPYICWLPSGHLVHLLSKPFRQSAFPQSFLPRLFPGHVCRQRLFCNLNIGGRDSRELFNASSQWRKVKKMILGTEPKFHVDWSKNRQDRGLCMYYVYNNILFFQISRFLDVANASIVSHMLRNLIRIIFFTELFCLVQKPRNVLNSIFQCKSSKPHEQSKQQCHMILHLFGDICTLTLLNFTPNFFWS